MRTLPVFVLLASALTASAQNAPTPDEQKTIDAVVKLGGKATIDTNLAAEARVSAKFEAPADAALLGMKKLPQVGAIDVFDATRCTATGFAALKDLPHLRRLVIGKAEIAPAAATAISQCKELRHLGLSNAGVSDADLVPLKKLVLLEQLTLTGNPLVTDKGMQSVKALERLRVLYLSKTSIGDKGLAELKALDGLRTLNVVGTNVTRDAGEKFADDMPNLRVVRQ